MNSYYPFYLIFKFKFVHYKVKFKFLLFNSIKNELDLVLLQSTYVQLYV